MEFNRLVSLVLGFIVLILAFVWISNRFRANNTTTQINQPTTTITPTNTQIKENNKQNIGWNPFLSLFNKEKPTLTPTITPTEVLVGTNTTTNDKTPTLTQPQTKVRVIENKSMENNSLLSGDTTNNVYNQNSAQQIPETGAATMLIPILSFILASGIAIKKSSKF